MKDMFMANWKMNLTPVEAIIFLDEFLPQVKELATESDIVICAPFVFLTEMAKKLDNSPVNLGCQNIYFEKEGAFTGETSIDMVKSTCDYVIVGHSERRHVFNESDDTVAKKTKTVLDGGLIPVLCVGELLGEREAGKAEEVVGRQLKAVELMLGKLPNIIAYEPVWAIGTGKTATPEDAQAMHAFIRKKAPNATILYGGSVKPENVDVLMAQPDINGVLVGGASLNPHSFVRICGKK